MQETQSKTIEVARNGQLEKYRHQPLELRSDFSLERNTLNGYRGRQILELLQNADDAADGFDGASKVLFDLTPERLIVANTGIPFTSDGLNSLVISGTSPKELEQSRFIGCKGLGFRCVLTWTTKPLVSSGNLTFQFDYDYAFKIIQRLIEDSPKQFESVTEYQRKTNVWPIPIMRFPFTPTGGNQDLMLAQQVIEEGYDTVAVLPFEQNEQGEKSFQDSLKQIENLTTNSLLFCHHINELIIRGDLERHWGITRSSLSTGRSTVVVDNGLETHRWDVSRRSGTVSEEAADEASGGRRDFHTAVAVPECIDGSTWGNSLCVFFPTLEDLPCHAVLHATLETSENRNRIVDRPDNREVLQSLGQHLADVAEDQVDDKSPLRALEILNGIERTDESLKRLGFYDAFLTACRAKPIFPKLDGSFDFCTKVIRAPSSSWLDLLSPKQFSDILYENDEIQLSPLINAFGIEKIPHRKLKERLRVQLELLSAADAGKLVGVLVRRLLLHSGIGVNGLLMDQTQKFDSGNSGFFTTPSEQLPDLPGWVDSIRFLDKEFQESLMEATSVTSVQKLVERLNVHDGNVAEYRFDNVARAIIGDLSERSGLEDNNSTALWQSLYPWLLDASSNSRQALRQLPIQLLTQSGDLARATECYLSNKYPEGQLISRLLNGIKGVHFVASPSNLNLGSLDLSAVQQFLIDAGVHRKPRTVALSPYSQHGRAFTNHVIDMLKFPLAVRGELCHSPEDVRRICHNISVTGVRIPEHFFKLVDSTAIENIIALLVIIGVQNQTENQPGAKFNACLGTERKTRVDNSIEIPNFILYWLRTQCWIPCSDKKKHKPSEVILSGSGLRILKGLFFEATVNANDPLIKKRGGKRTLKSLFSRLGAIDSLETIDSDQMYDLLLSLPQRDSDGRVASSIYRTLLDAEVDVEDAGIPRTRFLNDGKVWVKFGGNKKYVPCRDAKYNANISVPAVLAEKIPLIDLPRRKSTKQIKQLFGVDSLATKDIRAQVVSEETEYASESENCNEFLRRSVPYIYALRLGTKLDDNFRERNLLESMRLHVCKTISIDVELPGNQPERLVLHEPNQTIRIDNDLYVVSHQSSETIKFKHFVATLVAELLGPDIASEISNILRCKSEREMKDVVEVALGSEAESKLKEAFERFEESYLDELEDDDDFELPPEDEPDDEDQPEPGEPTSTPPDPHETKPKQTRDHSKTKFRPGSAPTTRPTRRRNLVVRRAAKTRTSGGNQNSRGPIATEDVTFEVVKNFEFQDGNRFVIDVSHLQGKDALGCDLISVASKEMYEQIRRNRTVQLNEVVRFIEVKGSSQLLGNVELTPNEYAAAEKHRERYFIYRVYVDLTDSSMYQIATLSDPVNSDAAKQVTRFDLSSGSQAAWYEAYEDQETD